MYFASCAKWHLIKLVIILIVIILKYCFFIYRPELVSVMTAIGNEISWRIFENRLPRNKPNPNSSV